MLETSIGTSLLAFIKMLEEKGLVIKDGVWLAGGAIRRAICGHNIIDGDFDIYVKKEFLQKTLDICNSVSTFTSSPKKTWYTPKAVPTPAPTLKAKSLGKKNLTKDDWDIDISISKDCFNKVERVTYDFVINTLKVQINDGYGETLEEVLKTFDFTCCQFGYDGKKVSSMQDAIEDTRKGKLSFTGTEGIFTVARAFRFQEMGFIPTKTTLKAMQKLAIKMSDGKIKGRS